MSEEKERILVPKSFQVQNFLVDEVIKYLTGSEVKILLVLIRQTLGWHKYQDEISITQFMKFTGLSNRKVIDALRFLRKINLAIKVNEKQTRKGDTYKLNMEWDVKDKNNLIELRTSEESSPVKKVHQCRKFTTTSEESSPEKPFIGEESSHTETKSLNQILNQKEEANANAFVPLPISKDQNNGNGKHKPSKKSKSKSTGDPRVPQFRNWYVDNHPNKPFKIVNYGEDGKEIKEIIEFLEQVYSGDQIFEMFQKYANIFWTFKNNWITKENHRIRHLNHCLNKITPILKLDEELCL